MATRKNRNTRRNRRNARSRRVGLLSKVYAPISGVFGMGRNTVGAASGLTQNALRRINRLGKGIASRGNKAVRNLVSRRNRRSRRSHRGGRRSDAGPMAGLMPPS